MKYIFKKDTNIFLSSNHPNLQEISSPKTSKCLSALRRKLVHSSHSVRNRAEQEGKTGPSKIKRLSNYDIYKFITGNNIQTADKFFCVARIQKDSDKKDLANYLLSRSQKPISDLFDAAKRMDAATSTMKKNQMSRIEILEEAFLKECICSREWFQCATQVLVSNGIHRFVFDDCICNLLINGRGKYRNIIITGPANCGNTFLLKPLEKTFQIFSNPPNEKYGWVGAENAEVIFLNDFHWTSDLIKWNDLLLLLGTPSTRYTLLLQKAFRFKFVY